MSRAQGGSLLVAGFECWPASPPGTYTIASENFGLGDPTALTRAIEQVSLDGERITGRRHSNRLLKLLVVVRASTRQGLDLASGALETATNQDTWQVQWTPPHLASESALPVIYEAYRAVTTIEYDVEALDPSYVAGAAFVRAIYIEAPAYPFGKSPIPTTLTATSAILSLDTFEDAASGTAWQSVTYPTRHSTWTTDTGDKTQGTQSWSATETFDVINADVPDTIFCTRPVHTLTGGPVDLTSYASISLDLKCSGTLPTSLTVKLFDLNGIEAEIALTMPSTGAWATLSAPFSLFTVNAGFDWSKLTSWQFVTNNVQLTSGFATPMIKLDNLRAFPRNSAAAAVTNGGTYRFAGVAGTARTSASLLAQAVTTFGSLVAHAAPAEARPDYTPVVPLSVGTAPPYTVNLPGYLGSTAGQRWDGTHAIWLGGVTLNGTGARTITVTFTQTGGDTVTVSRSVTPATDLYSGLLWLGIATLPARTVPDGTTDLTNGNPGITITVTINSGNNADRFSDLLVLDVRGPTVIFTNGNSNAYLAIDEPLTTTGVGQVYQGPTATAVFSCPDFALISGGPFNLEPGDNLVVIYSPQGTPTITATFHPRWLSTRNV